MLPGSDVEPKVDPHKVTLYDMHLCPFCQRVRYTLDYHDIPQDRQDVLVNKAIRDADVWTDHYPVISQMRLRSQPRRSPQGKRPPGKIPPTLQQRLREMQDARMIQKAEKIQACVDWIEMKIFFKAIKTIYGPCIKGNASLLSSGVTTVLTEKSQILIRLAEHFRSFLSCSSAISDATTIDFYQKQSHRKSTSTVGPG
ncbi:unnamed protein product [Schistocephalus solidus]|uniref:GST N-terminal domain-containing protein n=1 Tax=Schistocephalus solidus TaxID=70667 RepID=A0A183T9G2_SCHSO|nr:unnamed protein product [Schistocephalus solidus]